MKSVSPSTPGLSITSTTISTFEPSSVVTSISSISILQISASSPSTKGGTSQLTNQAGPVIDGSMIHGLSSQHPDTASDVVCITICRSLFNSQSSSGTPSPSSSSNALTVKSKQTSTSTFTPPGTPYCSSGTHDPLTQVVLPPSLFQNHPLGRGESASRGPSQGQLGSQAVLQSCSTPSLLVKVQRLGKSYIDVFVAQGPSESTNSHPPPKSIAAKSSTSTTHPLPNEGIIPCNQSLPVPAVL